MSLKTVVKNCTMASDDMRNFINEAEKLNTFYGIPCTLSVNIFAKILF